MCDVSTALMIGGTALSAGGALYSGFAARESAREQAKIADFNAENALLRGGFEAARVRDNVGRVIDAQTASVATQGGDPTTGSPLMIAALSAMQGETDARLAMLGPVTDATNYRLESVNMLRRGDEAMTGALFSAGSQLLLGIGRGLSSKSSGGGSGSRGSSAFTIGG